jgi:3',5'-cyclic AMP phosphodiesterase CpdA
MLRTIPNPCLAGNIVFSDHDEATQTVGCHHHHLPSGEQFHVITSTCDRRILQNLPRQVQ